MKTLQILMNGVFGRPVPAEFSTENYDYEAALKDELRKLVCDSKGKFSRYNYERNRVDIMELLSQNLDEVLPRSVSAGIQLFSDIMRVAQGDRPAFHVTRGKLRGKQFVTRSTESGNYESFRLDRDTFNVYPMTIAGSGYIDFERYLDGIDSLVDIYEVINAGMVDRIFEMIQEALLQSWNDAGRPAANKVVASAFDPEAMQKLCNTVGAYGSPVIYCSAEFAAQMVNAVVYSTAVKIAEQDVIEMRDQGYIGKFHGVPVVVMPQSFTDDTNSKLVMNPSFAYVFPAGREKIVKVIYEGNSYFREWDQFGDNGVNLQAYMKVGVAVVSTPNYWGIYYNSGIDAGGWEAYNTALVTG